MYSRRIGWAAHLAGKPPARCQSAEPETDARMAGEGPVQGECPGQLPELEIIKILYTESRSY